MRPNRYLGFCAEVSVTPKPTLSPRAFALGLSFWCPMSQSAQDLQKEVEQHIAILAEMTDQAKKSELFLEWLKSVEVFHQYSFCNSVLIWMQRKNATRVAGFQTWKKLGRWVKKGEKGIAILAPCTVKVAASSTSSESAEESNTSDSTIAGTRRAMRFRPVHVFDISQTEGKPLPQLVYRSSGGGERLLAKLEATAKRLGVELIYDKITTGALGFSEGGRITVEASLGATEKCGTIAHELAHEILHQGANREAALQISRNQRELEAEATSYVLIKHFGLEQNSDFYLASWNVTPEMLTVSMTAINRAVKTILNAAEAPAVEAAPETVALPLAA